MTKLYSPTYRPDFDGLRGFCLTILVIAHSFPSLIPGAYLAVDVFFVISGYLMTSIITRSYETGSFSFFEFYLRRARRIFPAFLFALSVILFVGWLTFYPDEFRLLLKHTAAAAFMYANWQFLQDNAHYFGPNSKFMPLIHVWSLAIEEQFYAFIPFYLWLALRLRVKPLIPLLLVIGVSIYLYLDFQGHSEMVKYWSTPLRIWELAAGGVLVVIKFPKRYNEAASFTGLLFLISGMMFFSDWFVLQGKLFAVSGALLIMGPGQNSFVNRYLFSNKFLISAGLASFSIYLWHWPLLVLTRIISGSPLGIKSLVCLIFMSFFIGGLSWKYIELPTRKNPRVLPWLAGMFILGLTCLIGLRTNYQGRFQQTVHTASKFRSCLDDEEIKKMGDVNCLAPLHGSAKILLIGDSHVQDKIHGFSLRDPERWGFLGRTGCAPITGYKDIKKPSCPTVMGKALKYAIKNPKFETLVVGFYQRFHYLDRFEGMENSGLSQAEHFLSALRKTMELLVSSKKKIIVLIDVPTFTLYPMDCRRDPRVCEIPEEDVPAPNEVQIELLKMLKEDFPTVTVFDPRSIFCKKSICSFMNNGKVLYRDHFHLNHAGSEYYAEEFLKKSKL